MARRSSGEGSVIRTGNGRWAAVLESPRRGGKRRRIWRRASTKAEAQRLLQEMRDEIYRTGSVANVQRTIDDAVEDYLRLRQNKSISQGTKDHDQWLSSLVLEGLGGVRIAEVSVQDCDDFLADCATGLQGSRSPVGRAQIVRVRRFLVSTLKNEVRLGNLTRNVALSADLPGEFGWGNVDLEEDGGARERRSLTVYELGRFIDAAEGSRLILADLTGRHALRPGEARALRWADIDVETGQLSVTGQQDRQNNRTRTKRRVRNATRTIRIDQITIDRLLQWQSEQDELRAVAGPAWTELELVASTTRGTTVDRHAWARSVRSICIKAGIDPPIDPYELRHTAVSLQADAGRSSFEIADWAGTSEEMISRIYRHRLRQVADLRPDGW